MKYVWISIMLIFICGGLLISCEEEEVVVVDPCTESPNCIPDLSDWKLPYKPHNGDCTTCHTSCTPNVAHTFCTVGTPWSVTDDRCLKCHSKQHLNTL